jgi:hypothetical protein
MRFRASNLVEGASQCWTSGAKFGPQMTPLVFELAEGFGKTHSGTRAAELRTVERETATLRLGMNMEKVGIDECD